MRPGKISWKDHAAFFIGLSISSLLIVLTKDMIISKEFQNWVNNSWFVHAAPFIGVVAVFYTFIHLNRVVR